MNKQKAEAWVKELTELLTGENLTTIHVIGDWSFHVRQNQAFEEVSIIEEHTSDCSLMISDTYGVYPGVKNIEIIPDERMILVRDKNGPGEHIWSAYVIAGKDDNGVIWNKMREARDRLQKIK